MVTRNNLTEDRKGSDISIAVLPFKSLSDDPNNQYLADGMMDAILLHLSKIQGLRVLPEHQLNNTVEPQKLHMILDRSLMWSIYWKAVFKNLGQCKVDSPVN